MKVSTSNQILKLQKHIQNTNKQIIKNSQYKHSAQIKVDAILGLEYSFDGSQNKQTLLNNNTQPNQDLKTKNYKHDFLSQISSKNNQSNLYPMIELNDEQILYYSCRYFIIYNLSTKDYQIINKDIKNCILTDIKKFNTTENDKKLIVCVFQTSNNSEKEQSSSVDIIKNKQQNSVPSPNITNTNNSCTYLALLTIKTDYQNRTSLKDSRYEWKVIKLYNQPINVEHYSYFSKKNYLYLVITSPVKLNSLVSNSVSNSTSSQHYQYIWVYDLTKQIMLINQEIKSNTVGFYIKKVFIQDNNFSTVYLIGKNYFRQWTINFNQRSIKQSNVRNVQRALKNKTIIDVQQVQKYALRQQHQRVSDISLANPIPDTINPHLHHNNQILVQSSKLLIILTSKQIFLVKSNQLICTIVPQRNLSKQAKNKDNIQKELQNSFNQIYKMKFLFDEYQQLKDRQHNAKGNMKSNNDTIITHHDNFSFSCISKCWKSQNNNLYFAIATNKFNVLVYQLIDFQLKLDTEYSYSKEIVTSTFKRILPTQSGDLLLVISQNKQVHLINQQNYQLQDDLPIKSLWGNGQIHTGKIFSITSPSIQNIMCTVGQDGTFKLWSMKNNQRSILFEQRPPSKPLGITIHPGGTMIGVNFERQIKLFSILPKQFYEITSIKTNYTSLQLKYSTKGQFLVSNEGSVLIFYQPFSLKTLGYIQPAQLKSRITDFKLSSNSQYVCFTTEDDFTYIQPIDIGELSKWQHLEAVHHQKQPYTAFTFDFYNSFENDRQKNISQEKKNQNIFIGATKNKYMVIYDQLGSNLIAQFPIIDCWIVDMQIYKNLLFVATSKGTVRVYHWPIIQQDLQMQVINLEQKQIRFKSPRFQEYQIWNENISIRKIHKVNFSSNQIVVVNQIGNMAIVSFQQTKNKNIIYEQVQGQIKKMQQLINQMFYIKKSQVQKRNKLIQKTQNDILKVENEIMRQKITLQRKMEEEEISVQKGFQIKNKMQQTQKRQYIQKQQQQIDILKKEIKIKRQKLQQLKKLTQQDYESKKMYEKQRNEIQKRQIREILMKHKQRINKKIQTHKQDIKNKKKQYFDKVKTTQKQFETEIQQIYQTRLNQLQKLKQQKLQQNKLTIQSSINIDQLSELIQKQKNLLTTNKDSKLKRISMASQKPMMKYSKNIKTMEQQLIEEIIEQMTCKQNQQIVLQSCRVEQLQKNNWDLQRQINNLKNKVQQMEIEDQQLQKEFQKNLEEYNLNRFQNLNLHSEVLKMQNQLIQRKQVLDNKQEIVMLAYQEKQKLQNYKQLVKGSLTKFQQKKQTIRDIFYKKQNDLNSIFSELVNQIHKMQNKKCILQKLQRKNQLIQKQNNQKQKNLDQIVDKLKQIKKFLLLERMNEQKTDKTTIYQYEESLMNTINFLKKRLYMESIKQKKNKQLKKSSLGQILKQNKNLLEQCNQLRSQGIQYQNQIKNLSNKLKEANKMISIETKLKQQKNQVHVQKNQLQEIKALFNMHLKDFDVEKLEQEQDNIQSNGQNNEEFFEENLPQNNLQGQSQINASKQILKNKSFDKQSYNFVGRKSQNYSVKTDNFILSQKSQKPNIKRTNQKVMFKGYKKFQEDQKQNKTDQFQHKPFKLSTYNQS